ncbi:hypothetical protein A0J61_01561 [Choanephora cucurbitarum]|uniref:Uncharacterized protein n=1 Tax=Choanephora cucurbitarum TaxID=101091 RepID=A0A1C7NPM9_9FUNG|nr:hypothetical protein A0J61_01561 [Choanephora cucurbitarum]
MVDFFARKSQTTSMSQINNKLFGIGNTSDSFGSTDFDLENSLDGVANPNLMLITNRGEY